MWTRLLVALVLCACAGCEQSSYSSSNALPVARPMAPAESSNAVAPAEKPALESTVEPPVETPPVSAAAPVPIKDYTFDDIKFDIEKDGKFERSMLTPKIEELAGRPIRIRGYILPSSVFQQSGIRHFVLVRDNQECCFGPGAALYDCIVVEMVAPNTAEFTIRPVTVEGTFGIRELLDLDGVVRAIYRLEAKSVK